MNVFIRLFLVLLSFVTLYFFTTEFTSSVNLPIGEGLMLISSIPASLLLFTAACHTQKHTNEIVPVMVMLAGTFFVVLFYGMYKQSSELPPLVFSWLGIMLCVISVLLLMRSTARAQPA